MRIFHLLAGLCIACLMIFLITPNLLTAQDCAPLDPRQQIAEKTTQDIAGAAQTVFKVGRLNGSYTHAVEREVKNLYDKYPEADRIVVKDKLIYLFCTTLKASTLSSDRKIQELKDFTRDIQDIRGTTREQSHHQSEPRNQINRATQQGDGNEVNQVNKSQTPGGRQQNESTQVGQGNRVIQSNQ